MSSNHGHSALAAFLVALGAITCGAPASGEWARAPRIAADERNSPRHAEAAVIWASEDNAILGKTFRGSDPTTLATRPSRILVPGEDRRLPPGHTIQFCGDAFFIVHRSEGGIEGRFWSLDLSTSLSGALVLGPSGASSIETAWRETEGWIVVLWTPSDFDIPKYALVDAVGRRVLRRESTLAGVGSVVDCSIAASRSPTASLAFGMSYVTGPRFGAMSVHAVGLGVLRNELHVGVAETVSPRPSWYSHVAIDYHGPTAGYYVVYANRLAERVDAEDPGDMRIRGALLTYAGLPTAHHDLAECIFYRTDYVPLEGFVFRQPRDYGLDLAVDPNGGVVVVYTQADVTFTSEPVTPNLWPYAFSLRSVSPALVWRHRPRPLDAARHVDGRSMFEPHMVWTFDSLSAYEEGSLSASEQDWSLLVVPAGG